MPARFLKRWKGRSARQNTCMNRLSSARARPLLLALCPALLVMQAACAVAGDETDGLVPAETAPLPLRMSVWAETHTVLSPRPLVQAGEPPGSALDQTAMGIDFADGTQVTPLRAQADAPGLQVESIAAAPLVFLPAPAQAAGEIEIHSAGQVALTDPVSLLPDLSSVQSEPMEEGSASAMQVAALGPPGAVARSADNAPAAAPDSAAADASSSAARVLDLNALRGLLGLPQRLPVSYDGSSADQPGEPLDLLQSAWRGLSNSLDVEAARGKLESFGYTRDAARGSLLPHLDFNASAGRGELESVTAPKITSRKTVTTTLRQTLIDEVARHEWRRQDRLTQSAELQLESASSNAMMEVTGAWLSALQAAVNVRLGRDYEVLLEELSRYIAERVAAGGSSAADRDRVKSRVANIRSALADSRAALQTAVRNLEVLTGSSFAALALDVPTEALQVPLSRSQARELALYQNQDLLAARAEAAAAAIERASAKARYLPKLDVEVSQNRSLNAIGALGYTHDTTAMLVLSMSVLNGGADRAQVDAADARRRQLDATARSVERKLLQEIDTAYSNLDAAANRFTSVRDELSANERVVAAYRAQLVGANRQLLDVLDAYQHLYQSRLDLTQTLVSQAQNQIRVAHLTGLLGQMVAR